MALLLLGGCGDESLFAQLEKGGDLVVVTRNSPTTYYFDSETATGFEYDLLAAFAEANGYRLRIKLAFSLEELIETVAKGEAHIAAAGLTHTPERDQRFLASNPYLTQRPLVIYKSGRLRPRSHEDLLGRDLVALAGSSHVEALEALKTKLPELEWREIRAADTLELMQQVTEEKAELAIIDSLEFRTQQGLFPRLVAAMDLDKEEDIVWYLPKTDLAAGLLAEINQFIGDFAADERLEKLKRKHFGRIETATRIGTLTFKRKINSALPEWQELIETVAAEYRLDWRLLAAIAYQESHWDPRAESPTGVKGMMMITQSTANELGLTDRTDPTQSLRGGARFLNNLVRRLPEDIKQPDRTWLALAAYNIGLGHLEDARKLTEAAGLDPHRWQDVRRHLPELQNPDVYRNVRYGFARGREAAAYVDNIRHYFSVLKLHDVPGAKIPPPLDAATLLPPEFSRLAPAAL